MTKEEIQKAVEDMVWRVWVHNNKIRVFGNTRGSAYKFSTEYSFRVWPWTGISGIRKGINKVKKTIMCEAAIVMSASNDQDSFIKKAGSQDE